MMHQSTLRGSLGIALALIGTLGAAILSAQPPAGNAAIVGNAARGQPLFSDTFNCYACHGFDAQSGERRLVPLTYTQEGFITFVQSSPLPNMPAYPDASAQDLADIYAYIRTIPVDAPAVNDLPLLRDILERKNRAAAQ
ncbi:MAG TPA: c-type cytochrome [Gammaproteobacteria bacterium]